MQNDVLDSVTTRNC